MDVTVIGVTVVDLAAMPLPASKNTIHLDFWATRHIVFTGTTIIPTRRMSDPGVRWPQAGGEV